ncbi:MULTISPECIES: GGDEF domain-containing protein [unclassified Rhodanobacter]|uniref:GGDEF domain-containing protein n=1 Tax=unclassified Rhodanobacter TaxID=2621553 RepID=UPI001BDDEDFE|nr:MULTISPECIES: GGDEF domain-containing protein [unclassified Rhodanobacter]MBT2143069.1 GGDEF domain-containing protein [Rhodanobacter sp. LX-99]MBT2147858.1 GGDEF domain-containing protein [Rhodanobacter sp. LX-100]
MPIDMATLALMGAVQALLMAVMLWTSTGSYSGVARASLRLRAGALVLEATAWVLLGLRGQVGDWLSILVANAVMLVSYAMTVHALRMLLGAPSRLRVVAIASVAGWLAIAWFAWGTANFQVRVLCASLVILLDLALLIAPLCGSLRRGGSAAQRVLLSTLAVAVAMVLWRNAEPLLSSQPAGGLLAPTPINTVYMMFSAMQPLFTSIGFLLLYNETMQAELRSLARTDPLTGVNNRLALVEAIGHALDAAAGDGRPLGVLMLDVDHFKAVNDRFGHGGGDRVLLSLVERIQRVLGRDDVLGRVGGEEFVVLSPGGGLRRTRALAERIRAEAEGMQLVFDGHALGMTVSVGVTEAAPGERDVTALLQRADAALYAAKRAGRNRVVATGDVVPASLPAPA